MMDSTRILILSPSQLCSQVVSQIWIGIRVLSNLHLVLPTTTTSPVKHPV